MRVMHSIVDNNKADAYPKGKIKCRRLLNPKESLPTDPVLKGIKGLNNTMFMVMKQAVMYFIQDFPRFSSSKYMDAFRGSLVELECSLSPEKDESSTSRYINASTVANTLATELESFDKR